MHLNLLLTLLLPSVVFAGPRNSGILFRRQATCSDPSLAVCEQRCMPVDAVCCNDGSSTFCTSGNTCVPGACCPTGSTCTGTGGTLTIPNSATVVGSDSATSVIATSDPCYLIGAVITDCVSAVPSFTVLAASDQASCLCFDTSSYIGSAFDAVVTSCAAELSAGGQSTDLTLVTSLFGFCASNANVGPTAAPTTSAPSIFSISNSGRASVTNTGGIGGSTTTGTGTSPSKGASSSNAAGSIAQSNVCPFYPNTSSSSTLLTRT
jgi:hypothetical protein